jgi:hypothetical protein
MLARSFKSAAPRVAVLALLVAAAMAMSAEPASGTTGCKRVVVRSGYVTLTATNIHGKRVSCKTARRVARAVLTNALHYGDCFNAPRRCTVHGFRCHEHIRHNGDGPTRCVRGHRIVRYTEHDRSTA